MTDAGKPTDVTTPEDSFAQAEAKEGDAAQAVSPYSSAFSGDGDSAVQPVMAGLAPADVDFMPPLLRSLSTLLRLKGKVVSAQTLLAQLAGIGRLTPSICLRAVESQGLHGSILYRKGLDSISPLTLPCILLLQGDRSCVLTALHGDAAEVLLPETGDAPQIIPLDQLTKEYSDYALFAALESKIDKRSDLRLSVGKRWFWDVLRYYMPIYRHVALSSVVINVIGVLSPLFVMNVYDRVVPNNAMDTLWVLAVGIMIAYICDFLLRTLRNHFVDVAGRNADVVLSSKLMNKVLTMRMDAKPESTGGLVNNLREFESLREFFSSSTLLACIDVPFLVLFLFILSFIAGPMVIIPLCAMPILLFAGLILQAGAKRSAETGYKQNMHKNALLVEIVNGLETLKCCMAESRMQRLWETVVGVSAKSAGEARKYNNLAVSISTLVTQLVTVGMVIWGVYRIRDGELTVGGLIGANILVGRAMAPLMQLATLLTRLQNSRVSLQALDILMTLPVENQEENTLVDFGMLEPSFALEDVSFAYPGAERDSLANISLRIKPGEKVGIIGRMGSGKSTMGKLLIGLYPPKEGAVKFGDVDVRQLPGADLRGRVGFLPQEVVLFYGTIRDNIALGDPSINDHLILRAASLAGAMDFIRSNPAGFGAQVGEQGRNLSGGQRQAVALARALVRDPGVLILDEPTSNMDIGSEQRVQKHLQDIIGDKTLILITHRLSMLSMVDRLIVMEGGHVLLDGPKEAVLRRLRAQTPGQAAGKAAQTGQSATTASAAQGQA